MGPGQVVAPPRVCTLGLPLVFEGSFVHRRQTLSYLPLMTHERSPRRGEPPPDLDPVVEAYKRDIDRTLLRENLDKSVEERLSTLVALQRLAEEARRAGRSASRRN